MRPQAERPTAESVEARLAVLESAKRGDIGPALAGLSSADDRVRATSLTALDREGALDEDQVGELAGDVSARVRRSLAEVLATHPEWPLHELLRDGDDSVVETACWAAGERLTGQDLPRLVEIARDHPDALCREAAVAALGAIGDPSGLEAVLAALDDRATVRRRAVLALAPFDDERVEAALRAALDDRDWQVRQAAEDLLG